MLSAHYPESDKKASRRSYLSFFLILFISFLLFIHTTQVACAVVIDSDIRLTNTSNADHPAWSPDGERIVYACEQAIWIMNSDGTGKNKLYDGMAWEGEPEFNADGTRIYFAAESKKAYSARYISIHVMETDGSNGQKLTETVDSRAPSESPDGSRLAYTSRASGNYDIWTMSPEGTDKIRMTDADGDESSPSWNPDGNTLVYSYMGDIFTMGIDDVRAVQLTDDTYDNIEPAFSPDGSMIAYASDIGGDYNLWLINKTDRSHIKITGDSSLERAPAWSPDGSRIAYVSNRGGEYNIWVMTLGDGKIQFEAVEEPVYQEDESVNNIHVERLRNYAANKPREFIGIILLISFGFVVLVVGSFMRRIS